MAGTLKITDLVTFSYLDHNWAKVRDDYEGAFKPETPGQTHPSGMGTINQGQQSVAPGQQGLLVQIAATHAGIITRNNGFYLPDRMRKGAATFTKDYPKPVLLHHEDHKDPIGRIIDAQYMDTSGLIQDKYKGLEVRNSSGEVVGKITETLIKDFVGDKMPFGQQVDVVRTLLRDSMLEDKGYQGLGYIKILANITDPEAIQKLLDGRYITGSVGATTNKAICSVCRTDWTEGGPCEHKPGGVYDEAKCFIIAGDLVYDEYSFVNVPADRHSRVLQLDYNGNHAEIEVVNDYKGRIYEVQLGFPQYDSVNKEEKGMAKNAKKTDGTENTEGNLEIKDATTNPAPDAEAQKTEGAPENVADSATSENENPGAEETAVQDEKDQGDGSIQDDANTEENNEESLEDFVVRVLDSEEEITLSEEEDQRLYDALWAEVEAALADGELPVDPEELQDAKLSTASRNKLPKSSFCGPGRSFPVPDCAHVTAARRLVGRAKVSDATKQKILACVSRKAKAMGCGGSKSKDAVNEGQVQDNMEHSRMLRMVLEILDADTYYSDESVLDEEEKKLLQSIIKRMASLVGKDSFQSALFEAELAHDEAALLDEVAKLEDTVGDLRDRLEATQKEHHLLFQDVEELNDALVQEKAKVREAKEAQMSTLVALRDTKIEDQDFTQLSDSDLDSEIKRTLEVVDMVKITDKLGDGMSRTPEGTVDDPTGVQDAENQKSKVSLDTLKKVHEHWTYLKFAKGQQAAENYLADMKARGFLPQGLDDIQGGSN